MIKKGFAYLFKLILGLFLIVGIYIGLGYLLSSITTDPILFECTDKNEIYISTNGIHLDFVIPKQDLPNNLIQAVHAEDQAEYLAFGWGDKGFYLETPTWKELKFSVAVRAMLLPSETAMHVTNYVSKKDKWCTLQICDKQFEFLLNHITSSFELDSNLSFIEIPNSGYSEHDTFFEAYGNYNGIHTCNNWVNDGLKKAQVKTAIWAPFDKNVLKHFNK